MRKELSEVGYSAEVKFDRCWKVIVYRGGREQYLYMFRSEEEAINKFNKIN